MIVCDCRKISDEDENWQELVMRDDFKCGLCQSKIIMEKEEFDEEKEVFVEASGLIDSFTLKSNNE